MAIGKDMVTAAKEYAAENYGKGLNCAESVFNALVRAGVAKDLPASTCAICAGFGSGLGGTGHGCGAISAAAMIVGANNGRKDPLNEELTGEKKTVEHLRYNHMVNEFRQKVGTVLCAEICKDYIGDWTNPDRKVNCSKVLQTAVELACKYTDMSAEEILSQEPGEIDVLA